MACAARGPLAEELNSNHKSVVSKEKKRSGRSEQTFFNPVDQLRNIDRLGQRLMPLDPEASLYLRFRDQRGEKDNRCPLQFRVGFDLGRYFDSVCLWHHNF